MIPFKLLTAVCSFTFFSGVGSQKFSKRLFLLFVPVLVSEEETEFSATLGAKNGVASHHYTFKILSTNTNTGKYSDIMINGCKLGGNWKPLCDYPNYCKKFVHQFLVHILYFFFANAF